ncbi:hypothetical protein HanXRQr2_Chr06g0268391 [Helianthus annuus]|uniref:Uncharacterized protein n=1 Tax=Helianthus annuus TaxID=4232 RepID=A0A251UJZ3_HELAN|nr:hypothetical protein HanXRQr2_Chr06g0268391 [Helianthus annuus]
MHLILILANEDFISLHNLHFSFFSFQTFCTQIVLLLHSNFDNFYVINFFM